MLDIITFSAGGRHPSINTYGRYIGPKKYKRCSILYDARNTFKSFESFRIEHTLICVGVYGLDDKDHKQVFGEAELLIDEIRLKHHDIKIIFSEITPRKDGRDPEVIAFDQLLESYAK